MTTLVSICQTALRETGRYSVPATYVGNTDPTAVRTLALANRAARFIALDHPWQVLVTPYTFPTVASTASYAVPAGFHAFVDRTMWDQTNNCPIRGPVSPVDWNALQSSGVQVGSPFQQYFRQIGNLIYIGPTPAGVATIGYDYYSKYWITNQSIEEFAADTDEPLIDADLLVLELRWRILQQIGDDYEPVKQEARERLDALQAKDGGRDIISAGERDDPYDGYGNLPEGNFGV